MPWTALDWLEDAIVVADTLPSIVVVALLLATAIAVAVWPLERGRGEAS